MSLEYLSLPSASQNFERFTLISDHTKNDKQYPFNTAIQQYISSDLQYPHTAGVQARTAYLNSELSESSESLRNAFSTATSKEIYYGTLRANLVGVSSESDLNHVVTQSTLEMMNNGMGDLSNDLLPFITMLMHEQHIHYYDRDRAKAKPSAKGIVTAVQMLNTMGTLDTNNKAGVCRDTHDMGLRVLRNMYRVYLDNTYPGNNYQVDDYIFLQAWVTPTSQHVTLVVVDPENPRNFHELDWGRVIRKTDQEGIEIGKSVGPAIRLWQFDKDKNVSVAFNLVRSRWGAFLDKELLNDDEQWQLNGIFLPQYASHARFRFDVGQEGEAVVSAGMMAAREPFLSSTLRTGKHSKKMGRILEYNGFAGLQTMFIDDTYRKAHTMMWADWNSSSNISSSLRYIAGLKSYPLNLSPNFQLHFFAKSQLEVFLTMSYIDSNEPEFNTGTFKSGDGNIWTTWGAELSFRNNTRNIEVALNYIDRRFLIPKDVRLLSPHPVELLRSATIVQSGQGTQLKASVKLPKSKVNLETRFEQDALGSQFTYGGIEFQTVSNRNSEWLVSAGNFMQPSGIDYYWYGKDRSWLSTGLNFKSQQATFSIFAQRIGVDDFSTGISISKSFR
ncbi:MAG: hypothetical protein AB7K37_06335 [Cyclobacteriaceae bacterium]